MHQATAIGAGRGHYFTSIGRDDYYTQGGEPLGKWYGRAAEGLGLSGEIDAKAFHNLMAGKSPDGTTDLVQQQQYIKTKVDGQKVREKVAGIDMTYSVPKSVSVVWAIAEKETREAIQRAHDSAVRKAIDFAQEEAGFSRRGKGGTEGVRADFLAAIFQHGTSRSLDPHLHSHAVLLNIGWCEDGKTRTLDARYLYRLQHASWMVYEAELAKNLKELGFALERKGKTFELSGVPEALCQDLSKRRQEILKAIEVHGSSGRAREIAALETREVKTILPREELFGAWRGVAKEYRFTPEVVKAYMEAPEVLRAAKKILQAEPAEATPHRAVFQALLSGQSLAPSGW